MTKSTSTTLNGIACRLASSISAGTIDAVDLDQLHSDAGLEVDGCVAWHRTDDNMVVVWAGNDADFDMLDLAEVPVTAP